MPAVPDGITTRRMRRRITGRRAAWVDTVRGGGVTDDGRAFMCDPSSAGLVLDAIPADVRLVHLVGPRPGGDADGFHAWRDDLGLASWRWSEAGTGHYLESLMFPVLRYQQDERRVDVQRAASWLSEGSYDVQQARDGMALAGRLVAEQFDGAGLLQTAATTGRDLWLRTIPKGREWPVQTDEVQEVIRATSGQGRMELRPLASGSLFLPGLAEYDGRLMYAALCWGLASGRPRQGSGEPDDWRPQQRGRFLCSWTVPKGWSNIGLLPVADPEGGGWRWPDWPGETGAGWIDGAELALARAQGWPVRIEQHMVWDQAEGGDPLRTWADKLVAAWDAAGRLGASEAPEVIDLARRAVRSIVLHGIGAFAGRPHMVTRSCPLEEPGAIPRGAILPRAEGDRWVWGERRPAAWPELAHPEWSAAVWARCRVRLLDCPTGRRDEKAGALHLPDGVEVVALRTDAIYLTGRTPWPDDGKAGRLRLKAWQEGPVPAPSNVAELLRLRDRAR